MVFRPALGAGPLPGWAGLHINGRARALCNGKTLAFQARDTGSIPVARSTTAPPGCDMSALRARRALPPGGARV